MRARRGDSRRTAAQRGLTLIEVSMALAIIGTLSYGALDATITTQEEALLIQERFHGARITLDRMKRELTMAFVSLHQADDKRTITIFEGERNKIVFDTAAYEPLERDAHQSDQLELAYYVKRVTSRFGDRVDALVRRVKYHIDDQPGEGGREEVVVEGVTKLELEYYDPIREDWRDDWEVRVDDAVEMRTKLKQIQEVRDKIEDVVNNEDNDLATAAVAATAGAEASKEVDKVADDVMDGMFLPARVRIRLTFEDSDGDPVSIETQVEIPMTEPLWY